MKQRLFLFSLLFSSFVSGEDFSSPEKTLAGYFSCFSLSDEKCVMQHYHGIKSFYIGEPQEINYKIIKKIVYTDKEATEWNDLGIKPSASIGDVRIDVMQKSSKHEGMYSYNLRSYDGAWLIYAHSAWSID